MRKAMTMEENSRKNKEVATYTLVTHNNSPADNNIHGYLVWCYKVIDNYNAMHDQKSCFS